MDTPTNHNEIGKSFQDLFKPRSEEQEIKHDSIVLMAGFLSEIEKSIQDNNNMTRKELAEKINTSASYLTQVFRGNKPLNFLTLAKIKRALDLRFEIKAFPMNASSTMRANNQQYKPVYLAVCENESIDVPLSIGSSPTNPANNSTGLSIAYKSQSVAPLGEIKMVK